MLVIYLNQSELASVSDWFVLDLKEPARMDHKFGINYHRIHHTCQKSLLRGLSTKSKKSTQKKE